MAGEFKIKNGAIVVPLAGNDGYLVTVDNFGKLQTLNSSTYAPSGDYISATEVASISGNLQTQIDNISGGTVISISGSKDEIVTLDAAGNLQTNGIVYVKNVGEASTTSIIDTIDITNTIGFAEWDILLNNATSIKKQKISAIWDGSDVVNDVFSILEIGPSYTGASLEVDISVNNLILNLVITSGTHSYLINRHNSSVIQGTSVLSGFDSGFSEGFG